MWSVEQQVTILCSFCLICCYSFILCGQPGTYLFSDESA